MPVWAARHTLPVLWHGAGSAWSRQQRPCSKGSPMGQEQRLRPQPELLSDHAAARRAAKCAPGASIRTPVFPVRLRERSAIRCLALGAWIAGLLAHLESPGGTRRGEREHVAE